MTTHGDFIKSVSFMVDDLHYVVEAVKRYGIEMVQMPTKISDGHGSMMIATLRTFASDIIYTLVLV